MTAQASRESPVTIGPVRCPHLVFHNVLGSATVAALLEYVVARQRNFEPAMVGTRASDGAKIAYDLRDCLYLLDLSVFEAPIRTFVSKNASVAVKQLRLTEPAIELKELEIASYRDGNHFAAHVDTDEKVNRVRVLSCVYYFAATPRRFSGGSRNVLINSACALPARRVLGPA